MSKKISRLFSEYGIGLLAFWAIFFGYTSVYATTMSGSSCTVTAKVVGTAYLEILNTKPKALARSILGDCSFVKNGDIFVFSVNNSKNSEYIKVGDILEAGLEKWTAMGAKDFVEGIDWKPVSIISSDRKLPEGFSLGSRLEPEKSLPKTIEDAVRASGGTYGVINTNDPNAVNNFVNTVFDNGLTNSDRNAITKNGNCFYAPLKPGAKISCGLDTDGTAAYFYDGEKGEQITITVWMKQYSPTISITDANGDIFSGDTHTKKDTPFTITKILPYSGNYQFEIYTQEFVQNKDIEQPFSISFTSDKTHVQPDIRKDSLIEGKKYSIADLKENISTTSRKFFVKAYIHKVYVEPECPRGVYCKISQLPNITISEYSLDVLSRIDPLDPVAFLKDNFATLFMDQTLPDGALEVGNKQYLFKVSVVNTSLTNVLDNRFTLVSVDGKDVATIVGTSQVLPKQDNEQLPNKGIFRSIYSWFVNLFK